jgi:DNA-binding transcriptional ArsR family regulator
MESALKAIAEPRRRAILRLIWDRELPAGEIARQFEVTRPAISQHLRVLREADLIEERRQGTRRYYRTRTDTMADLRRFMENLWDESLERLKYAAEFEEQKQKRGIGPG